MSHDAFLAAIRDRPGDDLPRLVYADWLDETGDPADAVRAAFVRVQCELASLPADSPRRAVLEDREHELLEEHEATWLGPLGPGLREWDWRRGFLDDLTVHFDAMAYDPPPECFTPHPVADCRFEMDPDQELAYLGDFLADDPWADRADSPLTKPWIAALRTIDVSGVGVTLRDLSGLFATDAFTHLRTWELSHIPNIAALPELLARSPLTPQLTGIAFGGRSGPNFRWGNHGEETLDAREFVAALRGARLESLAAFDCGLTADGLAAVLAAPFAGTLRDLDVSDNPLAPDGWWAFHDAGRDLRLTRLDVSGTPLAGIALDGVLSAPACESLTKLEMSRCGSARRNMEVVAASAFWANAVELRAHSGTIPAATLEPLCDSAGPPGLRLLDLAANFLRTAGVEMLAAAPWAGSLTWLALSRNYLDDAAVRALAGSGRFTNLRTLHLAHNNTDQDWSRVEPFSQALGFDRSDGEQITDAGAFALAAAESLRNLRILTVSYTAVTDRGADALLNAPHWRLSGLGLGGLNLSPAVVKLIAGSPRLARLTWLDLSGNPRLSGSALLPLAESPYLSRLCELDIGGVYADDRTRQALRDRLGRRLSG